MTTTVLFQDDFSTNGPLNSANWDFNHWEPQNNPSYLGLTQMRQSLPIAENGMARIQLDTWLDGNAFPDRRRSLFRRLLLCLPIMSSECSADGDRRAK